MKIRNKIFFLHGLLFVLFALGLGYLRIVEQGRLEFIKKQEMLERKEVFARIVKMVKFNAEGVTRDYSLWDEMATFVSTGDKQWAKSNIDGILDNFDLDAFWIYNPNGQLIHASQRLGLPDVSNDSVTFSDPSKVFQGSALVHFFAEMESGIMGIHGATINLVSDQERKDPKGYFLVARSWDKDFLESLGALTGTKIVMTSLDNDLSVGSDNGDVGDINFEYLLEGPNGSAIRKLFVSSHSEMISKDNLVFRNFAVVILVFLLAVFVLVTFALISWISRPLKNISLALAKEDYLHIDDLASQNNEMGDIARLIIEFFRQKDKLTVEKQDREFVEKNLQKAYQELKTMQNQLFQREKMSAIGQLAAGVAHEINNPIGFISNNVEVLSQYIDAYKRVLKVVENIKGHADLGSMDKIKADVEELKALEAEIKFDFINEDVSKLLEHSNRGLDRIRKIVMDLRTFSRADSEEIKEPVKIENVIEGILSIVQSEFKSKAELIKEYGDTPPILCNSQRIGQVLINILVNATQAIKGNGRITIKTYKQGKFVCVDISDTGCGIPPENIKRLFDPFFTTKPVGQGTGLGLSVSYEIIKKHGGEIRVSSNMGEGSTFTLMFPYIQPAD